MHKRILVILTGWLLAWGGLNGLAAEPPATPEQIAKWVKQLGADDFDAREDAEAALIKAGTAALVELKKAAQSGDPEVKTRSARIAEKLKWAVLPDIGDLATVLPPDNIFFVGTPSSKQLIERIRKETALGRLYDQADLRPLWDVLREVSMTQARLDDAGRKTAKQWFERFGGPLGLAFVRHDPKQERYSDRDQVAFFLGINDPNPEAAMADFCKLFPVRGEPARQAYRGVSCDFQQGEWQHDGLALIKNLIVRSNGKPAMFNVIDAVVDDKKPDLASTDVYKEARSKISGEPLGTLFFNMQAMFGTVFHRERDKTAAQALGFNEWQYGIVTLGLQDGLFLEQAFCKISGDRRGLAKLFSLEPVSGRLAALCPADALLFVSIPTDGKAIYDTIINMTETIDPRDTKQFKEELEKLDQKLNVKVMDSLVNGLKGEAGLWLLRPKDLTKAPDTCIVFETQDAAAATTAADTLAKLIPLLAEKKELVGKADYKGRTCYFMKPPEKREVWEPELLWSWCADGARILVGQRQEVLQQMVLRSTQDAKGLNTQADFKRLLEMIPQNERGGLYYVNNREALNWAYTVGLPMLTAEAPKELKAKLEKAPKDPKALFKDMAGSLLSVRGTPDGVRARAVGGVPSTGAGMSVPFALFYGLNRVAMGRHRALAAQARAEALEAQKAAEEEVKEAAKAGERKAQPVEKKAR